MWRLFNIRNSWDGGRALSHYAYVLWCGYEIPLVVLCFDHLPIAVEHIIIWSWHNSDLMVFFEVCMGPCYVRYVASLEVVVGVQESEFGPPYVDVYYHIGYSKSVREHSRSHWSE